MPTLKKCTHASGRLVAVCLVAVWGTACSVPVDPNLSTVPVFDEESQENVGVRTGAKVLLSSPDPVNRAQGLRSLTLKFRELDALFRIPVGLTSAQHRIAFIVGALQRQPEVLDYIRNEIVRIRPGDDIPNIQGVAKDINEILTLGNIICADPMLNEKSPGFTSDSCKYGL